MSDNDTNIERSGAWDVVLDASKDLTRSPPGSQEMTQATNALVVAALVLFQKAGWTIGTNHSGGDRVVHSLWAHGCPCSLDLVVVEPGRLITLRQSLRSEGKDTKALALDIVYDPVAMCYLGPALDDERELAEPGLPRVRLDPVEVVVQAIADRLA